MRRNPPAPEFLRTIPFYHGTRSGAAVRRTGKLIPGNRDDFHPSNFAPQKDRVYLTPDIKYALVYADMDSSGVFPDKGYVFVVPGQSLGDILPDEDDVGMLLYWILRHDQFDRIRPGEIGYVEYIDRGVSYGGYHLARGQVERGLRIMRCIASDKHTQYLLPKLRRMVKEHLSIDQRNEVLTDDSGENIPFIGKLFIPLMSEEDIVAMFSCGANLAHKGVTEYTEVWVKERDLDGIPRVKPDGSNFFKVAD